MRTLFVEQMAMYTAYHRDFRNRLTHFVGVPSIAFSLLVPLAWLGLFDIGFYTVSAATLFAGAVMAFWIASNVPLGLTTTIVYLPLIFIADAVAGLDRTTGWIIFAIFFVGGWIIQLVGHAFEGRKPALVDNIVQIFIAPVFLVTEIAVALGLCGELHREVLARSAAYDAPRAGDPSPRADSAAEGRSAAP